MTTETTDYVKKIFSPDALWMKLKYACAKERRPRAISKAEELLKRSSEDQGKVESLWVLYFYLENNHDRTPDEYYWKLPNSPGPWRIANNFIELEKQVNEFCSGGIC